MPSAQSTAAPCPNALPAEEVAARRQILELAIAQNTDFLLSWIGRRLGRANVHDNTRARTRTDIAGDILADACLAVLRRPERFDPSQSAVGWILGHAFNFIKRHREQVFAANRAPSERREVAASEIVGEEQDSGEALEALSATRDLSLGLLAGRRSTLLETQQALASLLAPLGEAERQVVVLSVFAGYDSPRVAEELGIAPPAARKRLQRALDRLRAHIRSHPEEFPWIENLPALLEASSAPSATAAARSRRKSVSDEEIPCHSTRAGSEQLDHNLSEAPTGAARGTGMKLSGNHHNTTEHAALPTAQGGATPR